MGTTISMSITKAKAKDGGMLLTVSNEEGSYSVVIDSLGRTNLSNHVELNFKRCALAVDSLMKSLLKYETEDSH